MYFIGIDIGTSTISGVVYHVSSGQVESVTLENHAFLHVSEPWEKCQDPAVILKEVKDLLTNFSRKYPDIRGIGVTGQMHGILYVDATGEAVSPLFTWQDGRGKQLYKDDQTYASFLSEQTGYNLATGYGLVTHFYNKENDLVPGKAKYLCTIMDYVVMRLSGKEKPVTDYSNGSSLGFFDVEHLTFDYRALEKVGIDSSMLPEVTGLIACCGSFRGIPVFPAIGDNQAAFLGSVRNIRESIHITVGTSSQISVYSEKYIRVPDLDTRPFPGGGYILVGAALCGGQAFVSLKSFFMQTLELFKQEIPDDQEMYKLMTSVPHQNDSQDIPIVKTLFDGTRSVPYERGYIGNLSLSNFTPENLIVGFLKGISRELYDFYDSLPDGIKKTKNNIVGSGNALKKNPLLCQIVEEQFNQHLNFSLYQEEAAFGACLRSLTASGFYIFNNNK
jgi:sedoheptulokinase